jgi:hypothetical protein
MASRSPRFALRPKFEGISAFTSSSAFIFKKPIATLVSAFLPSPLVLPLDCPLSAVFAGERLFLSYPTGLFELDFVRRRFFCVSRDLKNGTRLLPDPRNASRFFFWSRSDYSLYCVSVSGGCLSPTLVAQDVTRFDVSSKYLVVEQANFVAVCLARDDSSLLPWWSRGGERAVPAFEATLDFFIDDNFFYIIDGESGDAGLFEPRTLGYVLSLPGTRRVFKCGGDVVIWAADGGMIVGGKQTQVVEKQVLAAAALKNKLWLWRDAAMMPIIAAISADVNEDLMVATGKLNELVKAVMDELKIATKWIQDSFAKLTTQKPERVAVPVTLASIPKMAPSPSPFSGDIAALRDRKPPCAFPKSSTVATTSF